MKNMADIENAFAMELDHAWIQQMKNPYDDFYLYYLPTTAEHDGAILICKDEPANGEFQLANNTRIPKNAEKHQIKNQYRDILRRLPVLEKGDY